MFSSLSWGQSQFDEAVEKATSELRLAEEDIALNLEICDQIRSKAVPPKDAVRALRRRLTHRNPNVQLLTLALTDVCVKNGGDHFLVEVAGKEFMDNMVSLLLAFESNADVRARVLRLVQNWATVFEGKPALGYVAQVYKDLSNRGFGFPPKDPALANSAMVDTSTAPEWIDSDVCLRCRTAFSFTNRKHHCRNCGQVFDQQCSAHTLPLPHFGIAQEVRVCDPCFARLNAKREKKERSQSVDFHSGHHRPSRSHRHRETADADLQRAIQLSLAESGASPYSRESSYPKWQTSEPPLVDRTSRPSPAAAADEDDPELRAAIEASLREARAPRPSAPYAEPEPDPVHSTRPEPVYGAPPPLPVLPNHDLHPHESDAILTFSQTVQDEPGSARRDLARVHALYDQATGLRPKLALSLDDAGRKEQMLGEMHEKLSHAVKLYDRLLTDQIAHPTWQRAPTRAHTVDSAHAPWYAGSPEQSYGSPQMHRQSSYTAHGPYAQQQHAEPYQQPADPYQHQQPSEPYQKQPSQPYQSQSSQSYQSQPSQPYQQQSQEQYQPQPSEPYQQHPAAAPPGPSYQQQQQQPWSRPSYDAQPTQQPPTQHQQQPPAQQQQPPAPAHEYHQAQQYHSQHVAPAQPYESHPPASAPPPPLQTPAAPPQPYTAPPVHSPPSAQTYFQPVQSPAPAPVPQPQYTTQSPPPVQSPAQPYYHTPARNSTLSPSVFPTVPTSNPQMFPLYGPGPPVSGLEQTEKKEVALIDL